MSKPSIMGWMNIDLEKYYRDTGGRMTPNVWRALNKAQKATWDALGGQMPKPPLKEVGKALGRTGNWILVVLGLLVVLQVLDVLD